MRDGALLAIGQVNADPLYPFTLDPVIVNPDGALEAYRSGCETLLSDRDIHHVIGCYTSSSRKEIIPVIEKHDALLWYPSHYEGFESCDSVVYGGAAPNQHLAPLAEWALPRFGTNVYCIGSNYIWPWENNRTMRQIATDCGGRILRERYLAVGCTDVAEVVRDIAEMRPDFIFNTLIGELSYAFYRAYQALSEANADFLPEHRPVVSCSLSEPELRAIGTRAATGHIASSVYFQSIARPENASFIAAFRASFGADRVTSADAEFRLDRHSPSRTVAARGGIDRHPRPQAGTLRMPARGAARSGLDRPREQPRLADAPDRPIRCRGRVRGVVGGRNPDAARSLSRQPQYRATSRTRRTSGACPTTGCRHMSSPVTNFRGLRAVLLHRQDHNRDALESQLRRIGLLVICVAPLGGAGLPAADVIFFDADLGYEGLFPWDRSDPPVPLVAVLASEAPGRLEWALDQGATSYLLKPIGSTGAFNALVVAWRLYSERRDTRAALSELSERVRARPIVVRATIEVMTRLDVTEERALTLLRQAAMRERLTVEALCARIAAGGPLASLIGQPSSPSSQLRYVQRRSLQRRQP